MSKRKQSHQDFRGPRKKPKRLGPKDYTTSIVLGLATPEEREIYNEKKKMQEHLTHGLSPVYFDNKDVQKEITFARIADETYETPWIRTVTIEHLINNPSEFAKTVMTLDTKIIPSERNYRYIPPYEFEPRREQNTVLRQFRVLTIRRYEYLLDDLASQAFNCYPVPFQLWKDSMSHQGLSTNQNKFKIHDYERCEMFLELAKKELVINEVYHPLSSLKGTLKNPIATPQDKRLFEKLKGKLHVVSADLRNKITNNGKSPGPVKTLQHNPTAEKHFYIPITVKAFRHLCTKFNITAEDLLDSNAQFSDTPKLTEREEKLIEERRIPINGWSCQLNKDVEMNDDKQTLDEAAENNNPNQLLPSQEIITLDPTPEVSDQVMEIPDLTALSEEQTTIESRIQNPESCQSNDIDETMTGNRRTLDEAAENINPNQILEQRNVANTLDSAANILEDLDLSESSQEGMSMSLGTSSSHFLSEFSEELHDLDKASDATSIENQATSSAPCSVVIKTNPPPVAEKAPRICETLNKYGKPLMGFKSKKDRIILRFKGKEVGKMEFIPELKDKIMFSTKFTEKDYSSSCKENCALRFMQKVRRSNCTDPSKPILHDLTYKELTKRVEAGLRSGEFQCDFKTNTTKVPPHLQVTLIGNSKSRSKGDKRFFTNLKSAMKRLYELDFFGSITRSLYCALDVEGVTERWRNANCRNKQKCPISTIHIAAPNGVHFQIHTLFDGEKFHGVDINDCKELLDTVLLDPNVCKIGHGVTRDAWEINQSLQGGCIRNVLEAGRIHRFLNKGQRGTGKEATSRLAGFTDVYPNAARIQPNYNPYRPNHFDFCKDPREWFETQHQYNRLDPILGLYLLDHLTLKLCDFWGYKNGEFDDCSVALPRLMAILLLHDSSTYKEKHHGPEASKEASDPLDSPVDFFENFQRTNPFKKCYMKRSRYALPITVSRELIEKQLVRNMPYTPVFYGMGSAEIAFFEPIIDIDAPLWYKNSDRIAQSNYSNLSHPHLCAKCGSSDHDEKDCAEENIICRYPFCRGPHDTKVCPMILEKCQSCEIPGHKETHHEEPDFDILKAFNTQKLFSHVHIFASLMNHKDLIITTDKDSFDPFVVFPKKGYPGDDANIEVQITRQTTR